MSNDSSSRNIRRVMLALCLAAPVVMMGCTAPAGEEAGSNEEAFTRKVIHEGATLRVTATQLNLRERGSVSSQIVAVLRRDDIVTCAADSGSTGWVNIVTEDGTEGWASLTYLAEEGGDDGNTDGNNEKDGGPTAPVDGETCSPDRATNIVSTFEKALHDTIAFAEGTQNRSKDGYNVIFSGITISSCNRHPNRCIKFGSTCSTAAGRYQFLSGTWNSIVTAKGYATFEPENQERGAAYLIASVRKASVPQDRAMTSAEFTNVITKLSFEWASLPPGQYGQPIKTMSQLRATYCSLAGC
jgi:muramidase (phage lysozyme)